MKMKIIVNNEKYMSGMTLKDETVSEQNNMALHVCENSDHIVNNREKLASILNVGVKDFVCANQTHSTNFYKVTNKDKGRGAFTLDSAIPNVDAMYTYEANIVLCCFTADCVPITFYNENAGVIGVIHSGWQGTIKEITPKLFYQLMKEEQCNPKDFHVFLGSCLSQKKFEVDRSEERRVGKE